MSILYYVSNKHDYENNLGINYYTLKKKIEKELFYLGKYTLTLTPPTSSTRSKVMSRQDVIAMLDKDRVKFYNKKITIQTPTNNKLHPYFITGFMDGDGSFVVQVFKNKTK